MYLVCICWCCRRRDNSYSCTTRFSYLFHILSAHSLKRMLSFFSGCSWITAIVQLYAEQQKNQVKMQMTYPSQKSSAKAVYVGSLVWVWGSHRSQWARTSLSLPRSLSPCVYEARHKQFQKQINFYQFILILLSFSLCVSFCSLLAWTKRLFLPLLFCRCQFRWFVLLKYGVYTAQIVVCTVGTLY